MAAPGTTSTDSGTSAAATTTTDPAPAAPKEGTCDECRQPYATWFADNALWNEVMRPNGEQEGEPFLCPRCFGLRADDGKRVLRLTEETSDALDSGPVLDKPELYRRGWVAGYKARSTHHMDNPPVWVGQWIEAGCSHYSGAVQTIVAKVRGLSAQTQSGFYPDFPGSPLIAAHLGWSWRLIPEPSSDRDLKSSGVADPEAPISAQAPTTAPAAPVEPNAEWTEAEFDAAMDRATPVEIVGPCGAPSPWETACNMAPDHGGIWHKDITYGQTGPDEVKAWLVTPAPVEPTGGAERSHYYGTEYLHPDPDGPPEYGGFAPWPATNDPDQSPLPRPAAPAVEPEAPSDC